MSKEQEPFKPKFWPAPEERPRWKPEDLEEDVDDSYFYERPERKE